MQIVTYPPKRNMYKFKKRSCVVNLVEVRDRFCRSLNMLLVQ